MELQWIGQAGYYFRTSQGTHIMIDPYLSDSLAQVKGPRFTRQVPIQEALFKAPLDMLVLTHNHDDHTNLATLDILLDRPPIDVIAPPAVCQLLLDRYGSGHNYIFATPGLEFTENDVLLKATFAAHSDPEAIGITLEADGLTLCHTGDTLFHRAVLQDLPRNADALFFPINGVGNNMNCADALRLVRQLTPKTIYPMHWEMFGYYGCPVENFTSLLTQEELDRVRIPSHYCWVAL